MTEPKAHASLSPSGAERWTSCPGSVALEAKFPDSSSEHADWGTAAHAVAEMILLDPKWTKLDGDERDAAAYKGRRIDVKGAKTVEVDDEMVETVNTYVGNICSRMKAFYAAGAVSVEMHVEVKVPIDHITGEPGATGTADCVLIADFGEYLHLDVNDLKGGRGVAVAAIGNKQLAMYADGARELFGLVGEFKTVAAVIHQPRTQPEPLVWELTAEELDAEIDSIRQAAARAVLYLDSDTPLVDSDLQPSDKGCRFCKAKATCPALQRTVQDAIGAQFEDLEKIDHNATTTADIVIQGVEHRTPADLALCMSSVEIIESWCRAVRAEAERRLFAGEDVPGYKLVQGRKGSRAWANPEEAEQTLKAMRLKQEEMYDFKLISPTTAEKLHKAGTIGPRQWPKLVGLITQSEGSPSVAPESDKRPALVVKPVADEFDNIEEDLV